MASIDTKDGLRRLDGAGALCSAACAAHCASVALFPSLLASLGLGVLLGPMAEWTLTIAAIALAGVTSIAGWRRHREVAVAVAFSLGDPKGGDLLDVPEDLRVREFPK